VIRSVVYKENVLRVNTYACYSWEMVFNVDINASFVKMENWKRIREKMGDVNSTEAFINK
jgi:hypothetical protein